MPKKKQHQTTAEQSKRFRAAVRAMVDAGELNPTEADAEFERMMGKVKVAKDA